mmetsp:Transcript_42808/g.81909  ORF Transcript_42808/g.81909 Transcript_42808/m.81909 type:complete len:251 (-) Transcript_42808:95-847(-)
MRSASRQPWRNALRTMMAWHQPSRGLMRMSITCNILVTVLSRLDPVYPWHIVLTGSLVPWHKAWRGSGHRPRVVRQCCVTRSDASRRPQPALKGSSHRVGALQQRFAASMPMSSSYSCCLSVLILQSAARCGLETWRRLWSSAAPKWRLCQRWRNSCGSRLQWGKQGYVTRRMAWQQYCCDLMPVKWQKNLMTFSSLQRRKMPQMLLRWLAAVMWSHCANSWRVTCCQGSRNMTAVGGCCFAMCCPDSVS